MADESASDIPVVSQSEGKLIHDSGGFTASGAVAGPVMVDTQTPPPAGAMPALPQEPPPEAHKGWAISNDELNSVMNLPQQALPPHQDVPKPGWLDTLSAAARESNLAGAAYSRLTMPDSTAAAVPGFNPYANHGIAGYEDNAEDFADAHSPQQVQVIKERINQERRDKQTIALAGAAGWASSMVFGMTDPVALALMLIPGGAEAKAAGWVARGLKTAATGVAAGELQQAALTSVKETTNYTDDMIPRLAMNALTAGVLGAVIRPHVPKAEFDDLTRQADAAINGPPVPSESTGGAAAVKGTTLEQESFAKGGALIASLDAKLPRWLASPTLRVMSSSPVVESRRLIQRLVDLGGGMLNKNLEGISTSDSVEMLANQKINVREASIFGSLDRLHAEHAQEAGVNALSKQEFGKQVMVAMENGDAHDIPQVVKVAKIIRPMLDEDGAALRELPSAKDAEYNILGAKSYFPTVWDSGKIKANRTAFEQFLYNQFKKNPKTIPVEENTVKLAPPEQGKGNEQTFKDEFHHMFQDTAPLGRSGKRVGKANVSVSSAPQLEGPNRVHLETLEADEPGKGQGQRALRKVLDLADKHGVTVQLNAVPMGKAGPEEAKLIEFYKKNGFKMAPEAPGAARTTMVREGLNDRAARLAEERAKPALAEPEAEAARQKKLDAEEKRIQKLHEAAQPVETVKSAVGPPKPIFREHSEILSDVQDTIDRIQHSVRGSADIGSGVRNPKSTKERVLDVDHNAGRQFMSDDFEGTIKAYMRSMVPHIEMHKQFGSITLDTEIQQINDAYRVKMAQAGSDDVAKAKLQAQANSDVADLTLARDRLLGQAGVRNDAVAGIVRGAQIARSVNYIRSLGGQFFSAIPDWGRVSAHYGLAKTAAATQKLMTDAGLRDMSQREMTRMGTALDLVLHTREHSLEGVGDIDASDRISKFMQKATGQFTKASMIAHWDASIRLLTGILEQDKVGRALAGEKLSTLDMARLAAHGLGKDELDMIGKEWALHGTQENGLHFAHTELWANQEAAQKFEQAIQKAASSNAFFIGKGDMPYSADTQMGKFMFQFKGFVMSSVERLALPLAQGLAQGEVKSAGGLLMMLTLGALSYDMKERAAGRVPDLSPSSLAAEALQRSGVLAFTPDVYDMFASVAHLPRFSKFAQLDPAETVGGPTIGELGPLLHVVNSTLGGKMTAQDLHKLRTFLPLQNLFYLNRLFNMLEGKTADALNLKNATGKPALDYLNPEKDTPPQEEKPDKQHFLGIQAIPNSQL